MATRRDGPDRGIGAHAVGAEDARAADADAARHRRARWWYLLLLLPFIGLLIPSIYARRTPELLGFPFFYWYQFAWVPVAALLTALVYTRTRR